MSKTIPIKIPEKTLSNIDIACLADKKLSIAGRLIGIVAQVVNQEDFQSCLFTDDEWEIEVDACILGAWQYLQEAGYIEIEKEENLELLEIVNALTGSRGK